MTNDQRPPSGGASEEISSGSGESGTESSRWPVHPAAELLPLLPDDELQGLAADIREHGLHEPVWLYDDPDLGTVLLDGRNRVRACALAGVEVTTRTYTGDSPTAFVVSENAHRRHLTTGQRAALAYAALPMFEAEAARRRSDGARRQECADRHTPGKPVRATDEAARFVGTSGRTVARYKRLIEQAPDLAAKVDAGEPLDRAERIVRDRVSAEKRRQRVAETATAARGAFDLRAGDFRDVLADIPDDSVSLVLSDPPYSPEAVPMFGELAKFAARVLVSGGSLVTYSGQSMLPDVLDRMRTHLRYWWMLSLDHRHGAQQLFGKNVLIEWKPLLWFVKEPLRPPRVRRRPTPRDEAGQGRARVGAGHRRGRLPDPPAHRPRGSRGGSVRREWGVRGGRGRAGPPVHRRGPGSVEQHGAGGRMKEGNGLDPPTVVCAPGSCHRAQGAPSTYVTSEVDTDNTPLTEIVSTGRRPECRQGAGHRPTLCPDAWADRDGTVYTGDGPYLRRPLRVLRRKVNLWAVRRGWSR